MYTRGLHEVADFYIFLSQFSKPVPEFIDPVFGKTSPICSFSVMQIERFGLVFAKTGSLNSGTGSFSFLEINRHRGLNIK
jgi:hypothetical protein